jgi:molybdenum cofactor cytidylyltransferase
MTARTFALIPAAGKSRRMGRPKLALPLGNRTVLERVLDALRQAGLEHILVVLPPDGGELTTMAVTAGADVLRLEEGTPDMQATVLAGLEWLEKRFEPLPTDGWLLLPADHPSLDSAVIAELLQSRIAHPEASIFIPTHTGKRGHPALIAWQHVAELRAWPPGQGLNRFLRRHAAATWECPVASPHVLVDLDTPADYELLRQHFSGPHFMA